MSVTTQVNPRLAALTAAGTSVWLDQIRRSLIDGGELQRLIVEDSLRGVTSNPAIFEKAILGSDDYDDELVAMAREGLDAAEIYDAIATRDRCGSRPIARTASSRSRSAPSSPATPRARSSRPACTGSASTGPT